MTTKATKTKEELLFDATYYLNAEEVVEYVKRFFKPIDSRFYWRSTLYGEKLLLIDDEDGGFIEVFDRWDEWRWEVNYYYKGLVEALPEATIDQLTELLVYNLCRILFFNRLEQRLEGIVDFEENPPDHWDEILLM